MLLLYHSHKHISYPIRTIARSAIPLSSAPFANCGIKASTTAFSATFVPRSAVLRNVSSTHFLV
ncbi:hypothetical protein HCR08_04330 [Wolbachia pipientis]|uniref:hypothetical protein n=1 Tax=Wolbachia TaxID=953 RepID=UPI0015FCFC16|nr:hypothetical protein [Wolbachia pipientis]MBA8755258.1 hypothetical protein [Wolbachia pipientis]